MEKVKETVPNSMITSGNTYLCVYNFIIFYLLFLGSTENNVINWGNWIVEFQITECFVTNSSSLYVFGYSFKRVFLEIICYNFRSDFSMSNGWKIGKNPDEKRLKFVIIPVGWYNHESLLNYKSTGVQMSVCRAWSKKTCGRRDECGQDLPISR